MKIFFFKKKTVFRFTRHADVRECAHCDILKKQGFLQKVPKNGVFPCTRILRGCSNKETHLAFSGPFYIGLNPPIFALFGPPPNPQNASQCILCRTKTYFLRKYYFSAHSEKNNLFFLRKKNFYFFLRARPTRFASEKENYIFFYK